MTSAYKRFARGFFVSAAVAFAHTPLFAQSYTAGITAVTAPDSRPCAFIQLVGVPGVVLVLPMASPGFEEQYALALVAGALRQQGAIAVIQTSGAPAVACSNYTIINTIGMYFP
jgi:hypothetical protein